MELGVTEIWAITFFCLTLGNAECAKLNGKEHGALVWGTPDKYFSEQQCVSFAETIAERWWNEKKFKVEYACNLKQTYEPFVPTRRFK